MYQQLSVLGKKIKAAWGQIFNGDTNTELQKSIAMSVKSNKDKETYSFAQLFGRVREWIDEAKFDTGKNYEYEIKNKKWQEGISIDIDYTEDLKSDSQLNQDVQGQISAIADDFVNHKDELLQAALEANGNAFDGTAFFANSRPNIVNAQDLDNIYTGTGVSLTQLEADLSGSMDQMKAMKIKGKPVNKNAKMIVVIPTQLVRSFKKLQDGELINLGAGSAETNTLKGTFTIVENYEQANTDNDWYLVNTNSKLNPLLLQERLNVEFKEIVDDEKDLYKYNWKSRYNVGYGNPMAIVKIDN